MSLDLVKEVIPNDLFSLIETSKYIKMSRENVIARSDPETIFENSATHFFIKNLGKGNKYHDFRSTMLKYDIVGTNITQEIPENITVSLVEPSGGILVAKSGIYEIHIGNFKVLNLTNQDYFAKDVIFSVVASRIQATLDSFFPGLVFTLISPGTTDFKNSSSISYSISGFDEDDLSFVALTRNNYNFIKFISLSLNTLDSGLGNDLSFRHDVVQNGVLSYPRLIVGGMCPFTRIYAKLGQNFPSTDNCNILHNILVGGEDLDYPDAFDRSRSITITGLPLNRTRRIQIPLYTFPLVNQLILPSFVNPQFELHLETDNAPNILIQNPNISGIVQSYRLSNIELNYYLLEVPKQLDDLLYQKALNNSLMMVFNGYQSIRSPITNGTRSFEQSVTYSYRNVEKLFSVMVHNSDLNNNLDVNRMNRFSRNGLTTCRFQTSSGYTYPRENLKVIDNDIAEFQSEYLRCIPLPLVRRKYEGGLRSTAYSLLNYRGDSPRFNKILNIVIPESFIIGINLDNNSSDNKNIPQTICDSSTAIEGGSGSRLFFDNINIPEETTLFTYLYYCGSITIDSQMMARIEM